MKLLRLLALIVFVLLSVALKAQEQGLSGTAAAEGKGKWGSSFFLLSSVLEKQVQDGAPSIGNYGYVGANYKLSKDERLNIRPAFTYATAGFDQYGVNQKSEFKLADLYLNYSNYSIGLWPGEWAFSGQYRIYLPTSQSTQDKKTITYLYSWMVLEKILRHGWVLQYNFKPTYYVQSQKAYRNEYDRVFPDGSTSTFIEPGANSIGKLEHYFAVGKYLNEVFTPQLNVGFNHQWYYTSDQVKKGSASRNELMIAPGTEIHVNQDLWFIFQIQSTVDINDSKSKYESGALRWSNNREQPIELFRPENTQLILFTFWTL